MFAFEQSDDGTLPTKSVSKNDKNVRLVKPTIEDGILPLKELP